MGYFKFFLGIFLVACTTTPDTSSPDAGRIMTSTPDPIERAKSLAKLEYQAAFAEGLSPREKLLFQGYLAFLKRNHSDALDTLGSYLEGATYTQDRRHELLALKAVIETHRALIMDPQHRLAYIDALKTYTNAYRTAVPAESTEAETLMDVKLKLGRTYATDGDLDKAEALYVAVTKFRAFDSPLLQQSRFDAALRLSREIAAGRKSFALAAQKLKHLESEHPPEAQLAGLRFYQGFYAYLAGNHSQAIATFDRHRQSFDTNREYKFRARYWKARALQKSKSHREAENLFSEIMQRAPYSYYGQLAALRLRRSITVPPHRDEIPSPIPTEDLKRAKDLSHEKRFVEAFARLTSLSPADEQVPGSPLLPLYYPQPYLDTFQRSAHDYKMDTETLLALARQESAFQEKVVTFDFGYGLMQVQAEKGNLVAQARGHRDFDAQKLLEASFNVDMGAFVLREALNHFDKKTYLAVIAYNAGIPSTESWIKRRSRDGVEEFLEDIPLEGTGKHVRNVLKNRANYYLLYRGTFPPEYF